ncbi:MAG: substrate-binding domain-containing protein [Bacteroidota bacterium]
MRKIFNLTGSFVVLVFLLSACNGNPSKLTESSTRGNITIACDESFERITTAEVNTFQSLYSDAKIKVLYKPEADVVQDFLNDSVRTIFITRKLTKNEDEILRAGQYIARTTKIAHDGICFITNKDNPDSNLRYNQVAEIFKGNLSKWSQINASSKLGDLVVVFDNAKSGNFRYVKDTFMKGGTPPSYCFAVKSNTEVIEYVKNKKNAIGIIGVNWISDKDDTVSVKFLSDIRIMGIGSEGDNEGLGPFRKPYQAYIAEGSYPLIRDVYVICRETFAGLGSGFASFVAGDVGQRIVLKSGLVPATMPIRLVHVKKDF